MTIIRVHDADTALRAAQRRKLPVPDEVTEAAAVRDAVNATARLDDPERPALPATAKETTAVIQAHAEELRLADVTRRAAGLFTDEADMRYARAVADCVPAWMTLLDKEYQALVKVVRAASDKLPADLTALDPRRMNWTHPQHAAAYTKAEGAAVQLDQLVQDRGEIVRVTGGDGGRDNALFSVAALPEADIEAVMAQDWKRYAPVIGQWRDLAHQPVARWVYLTRQDRLTLSLATPGEVRQRAAEVEAWRDGTLLSHSGHNQAGARAAVTARLGT
ncbi:hypothetical protein [Streptomyces sp. SPB074]|uniref:hypothetical protein n=1 Tax=Streptomyces sp. (strain SPB074) TaxID=465543 RepID=UPI00017F27A5|nr:hypothetical protein [Streptomyces sp. SPB074]EDY44612.1 cell surface glycoprotein [Streptomyces sp. SPB074]